MKSNKGITLVALVITIIVLLILAGVSISLVVGDNGVLTQAQSASKKTDLASADNAVQLTMNSLSTEFMGETWVNNVNAKLYKVVTPSAIDEELKNNGYKLIAVAANNVTSGTGSTYKASTPATHSSTDAVGKDATSAVTKYLVIADKNANGDNDTLYCVGVIFGDTGVTIASDGAIHVVN